MNRQITNQSYDSNIPGLPKSLLPVFKTAAKEAGIKRIAIVGGLIRDIILCDIYSKDFNEFQDIDIAIEGSASLLAQTIQNQLGVKRVHILRQNTSYSTVEIKIDNIIIPDIMPVITIIL